MKDSTSRFMRYFLLFEKKGFSVSISLSYRYILLLFTFPYLIWEIYWASQVGYVSIKWHTHLMLYLYLWIIGYFTLSFLTRNANRNTYANSLLFLTATLLVLFIVEFFCVVFKLKQTTIESFGNGYYSWHNSHWETWYRSSVPNKEYWLRKEEYQYQRYANSYGFGDREWVEKKAKNEKRVLCLGDSYTEGDGAPFDSTYVAFLCNSLREIDTSVSVMNAGTCGNDPFVNFVNYRDRLVKFNPNIIVQTISSGDLTVDLMVRGGMERFEKNGKVKYRAAPWWEPIYAISYISRFYFSALGYNELLMKDSDVQKRKAELDAIVVDLFKHYATLAKRNGSRLVVVFHPYKGEVIAEKYAYDFTQIENRLKAIDNLYVLNLLPVYISKTKGSKSVERYYWPKDGHHNSTGYAMMADGIYEYLVKDWAR